MVQGSGSSAVGFEIKGFKGCSSLKSQDLVKEKFPGGDGAKFHPKGVLDSSEVPTVEHMSLLASQGVFCLEGIDDGGVVRGLADYP